MLRDAVYEEQLKRLQSRFADSEARYMLRCLHEDLFDRRVLSHDDAEVLEKAVGEILSGRPLQYVTKSAWFFKMKFHVTPDVLIPRPETEELVEWALDYFDEGEIDALDIGTGSGCIAIALKRMRENWTVHACDVSEAALNVARQNATDLRCHVNFFTLDVTKAPVSFTKRYDLIVSNPPYIAAEESHTIAANVVNYEPHLALFAPHHQPLFFYEAIARFAQTHLSDSGSVFVEINQNLSDETFNLFTRYFRYVEMRRDLSGNFRMLMANGLKDFSPTR